MDGEIDDPLQDDSLFGPMIQVEGPFEVGEHLDLGDNFDVFGPPITFTSDSPLYTPTFDDLPPLSPLKAMPVSSPEEAQPDDGELEAIQLENMATVEVEENPESAFDGVSLIPARPICPSPMTQEIQRILQESFKESAPESKAIEKRRSGEEKVDAPIVCQPVSKTAGPAPILKPKPRLQAAPTIKHKARVEVTEDIFLSKKSRMSRIPTTKTTGPAPTAQPKPSLQAAQSDAILKTRAEEPAYTVPSKKIRISRVHSTAAAAAPTPIVEPKPSLQADPSDVTLKAPVEMPVDAFPSKKIRLSHIPFIPTKKEQAAKLMDVPTGAANPMTKTIQEILRESAPAPVTKATKKRRLSEEKAVDWMNTPMVCEPVTKTAAFVPILKPKPSLQAAPSTFTPKAPVEAPVDAFPAMKIRISRNPSTKEFKVTPIVQPQVQQPRQNENMAPLEEILAHVQHFYPKVVPVIRPVPDAITGQMPPARYEPRLKPANGIVQPPVKPPPSRPGRATNQLAYLRDKTLPQLLKMKISEMFRTPVDAIALQIPDYHRVVRFPMDLETISARLKNGYYWSAREAAFDFYLMMANCYAFNRPGDFVSKMGRRLESSFETALKRMPKQEVLVLPQEQKAGGMLPERPKNIGNNRKVEFVPLVKEKTQFKDRLARLEPSRTAAMESNVKHMQKVLFNVPMVPKQMASKEIVAMKRKQPSMSSTAKRAKFEVAPQASTSKVPERALVSKGNAPRQPHPSVGAFRRVNHAIQPRAGLAMSDDDDEENDPVLLSIRAKLEREKEMRYERERARRRQFEANFDKKKKQNSVGRRKEDLKPFSIIQLKKMALKIGLLPERDLYDVVDLIGDELPDMNEESPTIDLYLTKLSTQTLHKINKFLHEGTTKKMKAAVLRKLTPELLAQKKKSLEARLAELNSKPGKKTPKTSATTKASATTKKSTGQQEPKASKQQETDSSSEGSSSSSESSSGSSSESQSESESESE